MKLDEIGERTFLDGGLHGKCYELKNGLVLKIFNADMPLYEMKKFIYMSKHKNKNFMFPIDFVYDDERFYGYIMKKSLGKKLEDIFCDIDLEKFSNHSIKLEKNIIKLSKNKILLKDFHEGNIMYNGKILQVIDFDFYEIYKYTSKENLINQNLRNYKNAIINLFCDTIGWNNITPYLENILYKEKFAYKSVLVSELLIKIKEEMENYYKEKIDTLDDVKKVLRR